LHRHGRGGERTEQAAAIVRDGAARGRAGVTAVLAGPAVGPVAPARRVAVEGAVRYRRLAAAPVDEGAAEGVALDGQQAGAEECGCLVARERAVVEHQGGTEIVREGGQDARDLAHRLAPPAAPRVTAKCTGSLRRLLACRLREGTSVDTKRTHRTRGMGGTRGTFQPKPKWRSCPSFAL